MEKQYLCKPIIIKEPSKWLSFCVLIAFLIGLGERLVNRSVKQRAGASPATRNISSTTKQV